MNKFLSIVAAVAISSFLATNLYLLFSDKSVIPKSVYVNDYERMTLNDYSKKMAKEALVAPMDLYTVYVNREDVVESWFVAEGDDVTIGEELALLNTDRADGQRNLWEVERDALLQQETELKSMIRELSTARSKAQTGNSSNVGQNQGVAEIEGNTKIELDLNVDFKVDVTQEGAYTQAVAAAEQQLADVARQLEVVEAQLAQNPSRPALISPVDGVVSKITRHGSTLAIDLYSSEKVVTTYAKDHEWQQIKEGDRVLLQGDGVAGAMEGTVFFVSEVPAQESEMLGAYKALDPMSATNPLAYYEVKVHTDADLAVVPYGQNVNAVVLIHEAQNAVSVNEKWIRQMGDEEAIIRKLNPKGYAVKAEVTTPFAWKKRAVITEGLHLGEVAMDAPLLREYAYAPGVFFPMPAHMPTKEEWKAFGKRNYLKYMLLR